MGKVIDDKFTLKTYMKNKTNSIGGIDNDDNIDPSSTTSFPEPNTVITEEEYDTVLDMIDIYLDESSVLYNIKEGLTLLQRLEDIEDKMYLMTSLADDDGPICYDIGDEVYNNNGTETGDLYDK